MVNGGINKARKFSSRLILDARIKIKERRRKSYLGMGISMSRSLLSRPRRRAAAFGAAS